MNTNELFGSNLNLNSFYYYTTKAAFFGCYGETHYVHAILFEPTECNLRFHIRYAFCNPIV